MIARRANGEFGVCFEVLIVGLFFMALLSCGNVLVCGLKLCFKFDSFMYCPYYRKIPFKNQS
jgi:hypothetical protein